MHTHACTHMHTHTQAYANFGFEWKFFLNAAIEGGDFKSVR